MWPVAADMHVCLDNNETLEWDSKNEAWTKHRQKLRQIRYASLANRSLRFC